MAVAVSEPHRERSSVLAVREVAATEIAEVMAAAIGRRWESAALLLSAVLASGGCVAAGLAASPIISAVQAVADRSLERSLPADLSTALGASVDTLQRMGFRVDHVDRESAPRLIEASADHVSVTARLSRITGSMTRLAVRVEAGGL